MDKFERSSTEYCPHGTLCAVKASPLRASPIPAVARHGSPPCHGEDGGGAGNGHMPRGCACRALPHGKHSLPAKAYLLACETYGFAARNVWFRPAKPYLLPRPLRAVRPPLAPNTRLCHAQPTAESCPAPDETAQNGHFPGRRRESGKEGMPTPRGPSARHQQMGSRAMEWAVLAEKASQSPSCPGRGAHRKWLGAWGFSPCGTAVTGTATAASPNPAGKAEARAAKEAGAAWAMGDGKEKGGTASPRAIPSPRDTH